MRFFFDNNLGESLVSGLDAFGKNELVLITMDLKIRRRPAENQLLKHIKLENSFLGENIAANVNWYSKLSETGPESKNWQIKHVLLMPSVFLREGPQSSQ